MIHPNDTECEACQGTSGWRIIDSETGDVLMSVPSTLAVDHDHAVRLYCFTYDYVRPIVEAARQRGRRELQAEAIGFARQALGIDDLRETIVECTMVIADAQSKAGEAR